MTEAIFNTKEAAKFLRISPSTLRARRKEGLIPYYKTKALVGHYRYKKSELIKLQVSDV